MKIALLGEIRKGGGVPGLNYILLEGLLKSKISVDYYGEDLPKKILKYKNCKLISIKRKWSYGKWYSKNPLTAFITEILTRILWYNKISKRLIEINMKKPYDCILQLSQSELFKLGKNMDKIPPLIIFPFCHAAGELKWVKKEKRYMIDSKGKLIYNLIKLIFSIRAFKQKKEFKKPSLILGLSKIFNKLVSLDYGISKENQDVIYSPVRLQDSHSIKETDKKALQKKIIRLVFVSRISTRKGVQYIVSLSKRLNDLIGQIKIDIIGGATLWSDYINQLNKINTKIACYLGGLPHSKLSKEYDSADILLIPSLYEPGGIVVPEALSHGVCVVASDTIGNAEMLNEKCCKKFKAGDIDGFEKQVRLMIKEVKQNKIKLRKEARSQAQKYFDPKKNVGKLINILHKVIENNKK